MSAQVVDSLAQFERALDEGRFRAAYSALLAAWREHRAPELGALVERASHRFSPTEPLRGKTQSAMIAAWRERARIRAPFEARWLLDQLAAPVAAHRGSVVAQCLDELSETRDDPSILAPVLAYLGTAGGAVAYGSWGKVLTRLCKLIEAAGDATARASLEQLAATIAADTIDAHGNSESGRAPSTNAALSERIPKLLAALPDAVPTLDPTILPIVLRLRARLDEPLPAAVAEASPTATLDALQAAVLANLDDDQARAVWADALQAAGDPRGELIALQLAGIGNPKAARAAQKLVAKHWRSWVGSLAPAIVATSVEFDRGLLVACKTDVRRVNTAKAVFTHPNWATVKRLEFVSEALLTSAMVHLEEVRSVPDTALVTVNTMAFPTLHTLGLRYAYYGFERETDGTRALANSRGLPALRTLEIPGSTYQTLAVAELAWLRRAVIATQLETLVVHVALPRWQRDHVTEWVDLFAALPALRTVRFTGTTPLLLDLATGEAIGAADPDAMPIVRVLVERLGLRWR